MTVSSFTALKKGDAAATTAAIDDEAASTNNGPFSKRGQSMNNFLKRTLNEGILVLIVIVRVICLVALVGLLYRALVGYSSLC